MNRVIRHSYDTSTDPSLGLVRRKVASWLGLVLLAFNLLAGSGLTAQASENSSPAFAQELLGDRIVVCTSAGMVVMDRDGHILDTNGANSHTEFCVFCLPLMQGGIQAPVAMTFVIAPTEYQHPDLVPNQPSDPKPARLTGSASPRAPPLA